MVSQCSAVLTSVPFQFHALRSAGTPCKEARHLGMTLNAGYNAVVVTHDLAVQRMRRTHLIHDSVIATGSHFIKIGIALTHNGFPDQILRCQRMSQRIAACILRSPACGNRSRIAVLKDSADKGLDLVRGNGAIIIGWIVIPVVLATAGEHIAGVL